MYIHISFCRWTHYIENSHYFAFVIMADLYSTAANKVASNIYLKSSIEYSSIATCNTVKGR